MMLSVHGDIFILLHIDLKYVCPYKEIHVLAHGQFLFYKGTVIEIRNTS